MGKLLLKEEDIFGLRLKKFFEFLSVDTLMVFLEKVCGIKFLKHGGAVNFSRVVGVTLWPPACMPMMGGSHSRVRIFEWVGFNGFEFEHFFHP